MSKEQLQVHSCKLQEGKAKPCNHELVTFNSASGNVFIFVLLGVVLLAALAYTFSRGTSSSTSNMTKQQAKLLAQDISNYMNSMQRKYDKLRQSGCAENDISFEHDGILVNASAPVDLSCHMFDGANALIYQLPPANAQGTDIADAHGFNWYITIDNKLLGVGTDTNDTGRETVVMLPGLKEQVCQRININAGIGSVIPEEGDRSINVTNSIGNIGDGGGGTLHWCDDNGVSCDKGEFCVNQGPKFPGTIPSGYLYIKVLHVR